MPSGSETPEPSSAALGVAEGALKRYGDAADAARLRGDFAAKVLAGLGTTLVTALGIAKFSDLFPWPESTPITDHWPSRLSFLSGLNSFEVLAAIGVLGGFVLMLFAVLKMSHRLWRATRLVPLRSDPDRIEADGVDQDERTRLLAPAYAEVAELNDVESLAAYEARANRLLRISEWLPTPDRDVAADSAALISTEVLATQTKVRVRILRDRINQAVTGTLAVVLYVTFVAGVIGFGVGADYLESKRTEELTIAKSCAEIEDLDATVILPSICRVEQGVDGGSSKSTEQALVEAEATLLQAYSDCLGAAIEAGGPESGCDPLKEAAEAIP